MKFNVDTLSMKAAFNPYKFLSDTLTDETDKIEFNCRVWKDCMVGADKNIVTAAALYKYFLDRGLLAFKSLVNTLSKEGTLSNNTIAELEENVTYYEINDLEHLTKLGIETNVTRGITDTTAPVGLLLTIKLLEYYSLTTVVSDKGALDGLSLNLDWLIDYKEVLAKARDYITIKTFTLDVNNPGVPISSMKELEYAILTAIFRGMDSIGPFRYAPF